MQLLHLTPAAGTTWRHDVICAGIILCASEHVYVLYMMTVQFYDFLAAVEVQPQSVATPTHKFTRARYSASFDRCCTTSGTNNRAVVRLSGTRDKFYKSGTRFRDSWSLCDSLIADWPVSLQKICVSVAISLNLESVFTKVRSSGPNIGVLKEIVGKLIKAFKVHFHNSTFCLFTLRQDI